MEYSVGRDNIYCCAAIFNKLIVLKLDNTIIVYQSTNKKHNKTCRQVEQFIKQS